MNNIIPEIILNDGNRVDQIGLGVLRIDNETVVDVVYNAIDCGYRHIDGAAGYYNEVGVGQGIHRAISDGLIKREELWVTSKIRDSLQGYDSTLKACQNTLQELNLEYLDMYMIHWPVPQQNLYIETWRAFEKLKKDGLVKTIGVCNFLPEYLQNLLDESQIIPAVNQLEIHPSFQQIDAVNFTKENNIAVQAYSPMARGADLNNQKVLLIGEKYKKTAAQIILRWHIQQGNIIIPKTINKNRMLENLELFDFELSKEEVKIINSLNRDNGSMGHDPHTYSYS